MIINNYPCAFRDYGDYIIIFSNANRSHFVLRDIYMEFFRAYYVMGLNVDSIVKMVSLDYDVEEVTVKDDLRSFLNELDEVCANVVQSEDEECKDKEFSDKDIYKMMTEALIPFSATIEIVDACNLRCVHCYRGIPSNTYWTLDTFKNVLETLRDLGTLHLTLTGGEVFLHPNFKEFLKLVKQYGFVLTIQTNGTIEDLEVIKLMEDMPIKDIAVSLYSTIHKIHDEITGIQGSCSKTIEQIGMFVKNGLPVTINCPVMTINKEGMYLVKSFADSIGVNCNFSFKIIPSQDFEKCTEKLNCFSVEFLYECIVDPKIALYKDVLSDIRKTVPGEHYCQTGFRSITIDSQGNILLCNAYRKKCGCLTEEHIDKIWKSSKVLIEWRNVVSKINNKCKNCVAYAYCEPCPAHQFTLTGIENDIDILTCSFGKSFYEADERVRLIEKEV